MGDVFEFNKENEDQNCDCSICNLISEFLEYIIHAESKEQLEEVVRGLVMEAKNEGWKEALIADVNMKMELLDDLHGHCDCDDEEDN